jgi:glycosyltransferase involved in cell wall biosynthesis
VFSKAEKASKLVEDVGGMKVRRLRANTLPLNPRWFLWLAKMLKEHQVHVVIVRNLRLAAATIFAARRARIPVVMDLGENHPAHVAALGREHVAHLVIRSPRLVGALERWCVRRADQVWVVTEANRQRLAALRNGSDNAIRVIRNVPELNGMPRVPASRPPGQAMRLIYLGILDPIRAVDTVLRALALCADEISLVVVGDGSERATLEALAQQLGVADRVTFRGWVSGPARLAELSAADVGLIPHRVNYLTQTTEPNKLFDYMLCGLPVLSTPLEPVRRVLDEVHCGVVAEDSPAAFAAAIAALADDHAGRALMGERSRRAVLERYNWERESRQVLDALRELA